MLSIRVDRFVDTLVKANPLLPMNRWSYSNATDQLSEADFDTGADGTAEARITILIEHSAGRGQTPVPVVGQCGATLHVPKHVVPRIADLAGEQAKRVRPALVGQGRAVEQAGVGALEVGPIALGLDAPHPPARLPANAELATGKAAGCVMAPLAEGRNGTSARDQVIGEVPAIMGRAAAAVQAGVE